MSSTRHHLGIYIAVGVSARYHHPSPTKHPRQDIFYSALASVVASQPALRVGILAEDTGNAQFSHVPSVDLRKHVEFREIRGGEGYNQRVASIQGSQQSQPWPDIGTCPPWRVIVVSPIDQPSDTSYEEDVIFVFHHAISDGVGGKTFHQALLSALRSLTEPTTTAENPILDFPDSPKYPEPQEEIVPFTLSLLFTLGAFWDALAPTWLRASPPKTWTGGHVDFALSYVTLVTAVDFAPAVVESLIAACRAHKTTLTGLLHALVLASLSQRVADEDSTAGGFSSTTPLSLRPYMSPTADPSLKTSMRVLVSALDHKYPSTERSSLRSAQGEELDGLIWAAATRVKAELANRAATLPADDPVALLTYVSDWKQFWHGKNGKQRGNTWEVSNVGTIKNDTATATAKNVNIGRVFMTNGAMVTGAAIGIGVAGVAGGGVSVSVTRQKDIVTEELAEGVAEDLGVFAARWVEKGTFAP